MHKNEKRHLKRRRGNKASAPEGLICDLHAKADGGIPEDGCFVVAGPLVGTRRGSQLRTTVEGITLTDNDECSLFP